jgi:Na+/H+-translocating membrane pyrophosphatase
VWEVQLLKWLKRFTDSYGTCVKISTDASLREMIPPEALVMLTSLIAGTFFGVENLAGVLAGSLVSGVQAGGPKGSDAHNFTRQLS